MSFRKPVRKEGPIHWLHKTKGKLIFTLVFTVVHMLLTAVFFFWSYSSVMASSDTGDSFSQSSRLLVQISDIFTWPIIYSLVQNASLRSTLPDFTVYLALFLNSLFWALVVLGILLGIRATVRAQGRKVSR